jgi:Collagen triple helix repeat (20 copies)
MLLAAHAELSWDILVGLSPVSRLLRRSVLLNRFAMARVVPVLLAAMFFYPAAHATNVALTGDAHVSLTRSTTNFGTLANLYVGNGNTALLQFDLSTLPAGLTSSQVAHATLTVFVNRVNTGGTVSLSPVTSAWSEPAVTYATIPTIGAPVDGFSAATAGQYVALDVTSLVQGWVTAPATNFGLALTSTAANVLLDSKENDETGHAASLDITITSMGATGAQGPAGTPGIQGAPGLNGAPGSAGATGPAGAAGANGTVGIVSNWSSSTTYQVGQVVFCAACSSNGSSYAALATNTNQDPPTQTGFWQLIAQVGATGALGITGPQGPIGPAGAPGAAGATGATGPAGPAGATGTLGTVANWSSGTPYTVGQVVFCTTCSTNGSSFIALATNTNIDPPTNPAIWHLVASAGATGATGPTGNTGSQGPAGPTGPAGAAASITAGFVWSGMAGNQGDPGPFFVAPIGNSSAIETNNSQLAFVPATAACTVRSLTINALASNVANPIVADTIAFTVVKNDLPTTMTCTIATTNGTANNATLSCSDSTHTFTVVQGDRISLQFTETLSSGANQFINAGTTLVCD